MTDDIFHKIHKLALGGPFDEIKDAHITGPIYHCGPIVSEAEKKIGEIVIGTNTREPSHKVFCINCKHMRCTISLTYYCNRLPGATEVNLVTGEEFKSPDAPFCSKERGEYGQCGPEGVYWEEAEAKQ